MSAKVFKRCKNGLDLPNKIKLKDIEMTAYHPFRSVAAKKEYLAFDDMRAKKWPIDSRTRSVDTSYFVANCWRKPYYIYLIHRNSEEAEELAQFELPEEFEKDVCELKGIYALEDDVKAWLKKELEV